MRPLKSHFPAHALTTLATMLQQTKEARVFRRAQAVHAVVAGHPISAVSATFHEKSRWVPHSLLWGGKRAARRAATISVWPTKQVLMPFMT